MHVPVRIGSGRWRVPLCVVLMVARLSTGGVWSVVWSGQGLAFCGGARCCQPFSQPHNGGAPGRACAGRRQPAPWRAFGPAATPVLRAAAGASHDGARCRSRRGGWALLAGPEVGGLDEGVAGTEEPSDDDELVSSKVQVRPGTLYVVATPIGNLGDITVRAMEVLRGADVVASEDTRRTARLLKYLQLPYTKLISHHEHNWRNSAPEIVEMLKAGQAVALVSDAGSPDPS